MRVPYQIDGLKNFPIWKIFFFLFSFPWIHHIKVASLDDVQFMYFSSVACFVCVFVLFRGAECFMSGAAMIMGFYTYKEWGGSPDPGHR